MKTSRPLASLGFAFFSLFLGLSPNTASCLDLEPFHTFNQSPVVQIYGLPAPESAVVTGVNRLSFSFVEDISSNFGVDRTSHEEIILDGEQYRTTLGFRYGLARNIEVGIDVPVIAEWGGILDSPIQGWHDIFNLDQGGRDNAPKNRLLYRYSRNGKDRFQITGSNGGLGDIRLTAGLQLFRSESDPLRAITLRSAVKLPTGDSDQLHGSGGTDFALWISGRERFPFLSDTWGILYALGGMVVGNGDILPEMQRDLVAFTTIGVGWSPTKRSAIKIHLNGNTPFYRNSPLKELSVTSFQLVAGGTIGITGSTVIDLSFSEDILVVTSSPDFGITLALRTTF